MPPPHLNFELLTMSIVCAEMCTRPRSLCTKTFTLSQKQSEGPLKWINETHPFLKFVTLNVPNVCVEMCTKSRRLCTITTSAIPKIKWGGGIVTENPTV